MTEHEFNELIGHLYHASAVNGDLGHEYWTRVIRQLREMRTLVMHHEQHCLQKSSPAPLSKTFARK